MIVDPGDDLHIGLEHWPGILLPVILFTTSLLCLTGGEGMEWGEGTLSLIRCRTLILYPNTHFSSPGYLFSSRTLWSSFINLSCVPAYLPSRLPVFAGRIMMTTEKKREESVSFFLMPGREIRGGKQLD